ncbi:unnamed protein product [Peniophora sp. CBMAI 1063]|nr:unnamed protein product [Peniophora sp. CBMAI 1063]
MSPRRMVLEVVCSRGRRIIWLHHHEVSRVEVRTSARGSEAGNPYLPLPSCTLRELRPDDEICTRWNSA